jgi:group I intron endonuclease
MKNVIYKIRNVLNDHYYIGSTVDSRKRFWSHRKDLRLGRHVCIYLQRAWDKYGEDCFKFEIVKQLDSKEALFPAEQKLLDEHFGKDYCYNVAAYADAPMRDASPEMRAKLAAKTKAWLEREGHPRLGYKCTPEEIAYSSEKRKGKHAGSDHYRYGKTVSPEVRKKIGDAQRGKPKAPGRQITPEGRAKIMAAAAAGHYSHWKGKKHTDESRAKMGVPLVASLPDGSIREFVTMSKITEEFGVFMPTIIRACKSGKPIKTGVLAGWVLSYKGQENKPPEIPAEYAHLPRTRSQAKAEGATHYFTGIPCDRGHMSPRVAKGTCIMCRREDDRATYQKRLDTLAQQE